MWTFQSHNQLLAQTDNFPFLFLLSVVCPGIIANQGWIREIWNSTNFIKKKEPKHCKYTFFNKFCLIFVFTLVAIFVKDLLLYCPLVILDPADMQLNEFQAMMNFLFLSFSQILLPKMIMMLSKLYAGR